MKNLARVLTALALFGIAVSLQAGPLLINVDNRKTTDLGGKWQIIIDPYETGYYNYRYQPSSNGFFRNQKPRSRTDRVEYRFDQSQTLLVPGDWNTQRTDLFFYEGTVWYKRDFDYNLPQGRRLFVYFGAANYDAKVYLNGEKLGEHEGGFTPFCFEITDKVRSAGNFLVVKVDNKRRRDAVPTLNTDWWNYGGLTRRVLLVEEPETFIQDYFVRLRKGSQSEIEGWIRLNGSQLKQKVTISIPEAGVAKTVTTDKSGFARFRFLASLKLWCPEDPKLYRVVLLAETDTLQDQIGFRTVETRGSEILLNGKPVFLRGVCIHEEAPFRSGRAFSREDAEILLGWAKEMGCNFVRLAHYPHNETMIRTADRLGVLVWEEIPVYWTILWQNEATFQNARNQLTEVITRDKNRACVILWSMANETPVNEARTTFIRRLAEHARNLDPTRLLTAAMERHYVDENTLMIDDPLGEVLDVFGCNEYLGWYDGLPDKCDRVQWKMAYNKPLVISEFGGGALYGYHGDVLTRWTEEFQENLYKHQVKMLARIPFLRGTTPWILMDFRSPRRLLPGIQDYFNRKGLISNRGQKKKAFAVMQRWYRKLQAKEQSQSK